MTRWVKRLIVMGLSSACSAIDHIRPWWIVYYSPLRRLGCSRGMALWSSQLDERWHTGVWQIPEGPMSEHRPVPGDDFMPPEWCGACETCRGWDPGLVCAACSYEPDGYPNAPVNWPCEHAGIFEDST